MHSNKESFGFGQGPQNFDNVSKGDYDDDDDEEEEDYSDVDDEDEEQTHDKTSRFRNMAALFVVAKGTLGDLIAPE